MLDLGVVFFCNRVFIIRAYHSIWCSCISTIFFCLLFSHLLVTDTCMYVLRDIPKQNDRAMVLSRRPLKNIVKITSKKKLPELITFKYGSYEEDGLVVTDTERFIIEKAGRMLSHYYMSIVVSCL